MGRTPAHARGTLGAARKASRITAGTVTLRCSPGRDRAGGKGDGARRCFLSYRDWRYRQGRSRSRDYWFRVLRNRFRGRDARKGFRGAGHSFPTGPRLPRNMRRGSQFYLNHLRILVKPGNPILSPNLNDRGEK